MRVAISQSMYFPWVGMLEQIKLADVFVHYDDVQFSKGGFINRIKIKAPEGPRWLTIPLKKSRLETRVDALYSSDQCDWRSQHLALLERSYRGLPFGKEMLEIAAGVLALRSDRLSDIARASMLAMARFFDLTEGTRFESADRLNVTGRGSDRVLGIVLKLGGTEYITGHGARNYLDHERFERAGVTVSYMDYRRLPYPQQNGAFDPHVSALDLIANCGREGTSVIQSGTIDWRRFLHEHDVQSASS